MKCKIRTKEQFRNSVNRYLALLSDIDLSLADKKELDILTDAIHNYRYEYKPTLKFKRMLICGMVPEIIGMDKYDLFKEMLLVEMDSNCDNWGQESFLLLSSLTKLSKEHFDQFLSLLKCIYKIKFQ